MKIQWFVEWPFSLLRWFTVPPCYHVSDYLCLSVHLCTCMLCVCACMRVSVYRCMCADVCLSVYACACAGVYACMCVLTCVSS